MLAVGERVVRLDGSTAVVVRVRAVAGAASMWDLTVSNVHTFAVGAGESQYWQGSYTYDGLGNRTQVVENGTTTSYQYDGDNELATTKDGTGLTLANYSYDAHHNRTSMTTSSGTTSYAYDPAAGVELTSRTDPSGKQTTYTYDTSGNLTSATYDPTGADQVTRYGYDATGRLASVTQPRGTTIAFSYDGDGNRLAKTITSGTTIAVNDVYQLGHVAYETDGNGVVLASFSYDSEGVPTSVRVGSDPTTAPVYYYFGARHYDPVAAQFTRADTELQGNGSDALALARYAYVEGNPLTRLDPTGHDRFGSLVTAVVQTTTAVARRRRHTGSGGLRSCAACYNRMRLPGWRGRAERARRTGTGK